MRFILEGLLVAAASAARALTVGPLPAAEFADTEVSTNVPCALARNHAGVFRGALTFTATPSNNVVIAFGADADADGVLEADERDLVLGWDCGTWRLEDGASGTAWTAAAATDADLKELAWSVRLTGGDTPRRLTVTENGCPLFAELATDPPAWIYRPAWDLFRVTARGTDARDERLSVSVLADSFILRLR